MISRRISPKAEGEPLGLEGLNKGREEDVLGRLMATLVVFLVTFAGGMVPLFAATLSPASKNCFLSFGGGGLLTLAITHLLPEIFQDSFESQQSYPEEPMIGKILSYQPTKHASDLKASDFQSWSKKESSTHEDYQQFWKSPMMTGILIMAGILGMMWLESLMNLVSILVRRKQRGQDFCKSPFCCSQSRNVVASQTRYTWEHNSGSSSSSSNHPFCQDRQQQPPTECDLGHDLDLDEYEGDLEEGSNMPLIADHGLVKGDWNKSVAYSSFWSSLCSILSYLGALSFHSVLEGFTLATQGSEGSFWGVALTLAFHKWVVAFAFGSTMQRKKFQGCVIGLFVLVLALMTPLGTLLGMATLHTFEEGQASIHVAKCLALGTLTFICLFELLSPAFNAQQQASHKIWRVLAFSLGCGLVFAMQAVPSGLRKRYI